MTRPWWIAVALVACSSSGDSGPAPAEANLGAHVAARVGPDSIAVETVRRIAAARGVSATEARQFAIRDAVFALEAENLLKGSAQLASLRRSNLAYVLLAEIKAQARGQGPATVAELEELAQQKWYEHARPPAFETVHVVVLSKDEDDAKRQFAERLGRDLAGSTTPADFERRARELTADRGDEVRIESLPGVTADGRIVAEDAQAQRQAAKQRFDPAFAKAAAALTDPGQQSPVVKSAFGYHVISLKRRIEPLITTVEQRRAALGQAALDRRANRLVNEVLTRQGKASGVQVASAANELTRAVRVAD